MRFGAPGMQLRARSRPSSRVSGFSTRGTAAGRSSGSRFESSASFNSTRDLAGLSSSEATVPVASSSTSTLRETRPAGNARGAHADDPLLRVLRQRAERRLRHVPVAHPRDDDPLGAAPWPPHRSAIRPCPRALHDVDARQLLDAFDRELALQPDPADRIPVVLGGAVGHRSDQPAQRRSEASAPPSCWSS